MDIRNYVDVKQFGEKNKTKQNETKQNSKIPKLKS